MRLNQTHGSFHCRPISENHQPRLKTHLHLRFSPKCNHVSRRWSESYGNLHQRENAAVLRRNLRWGRFFNPDWWSSSIGRFCFNGDFWHTSQTSSTIERRTLFKMNQEERKIKESFSFCWDQHSYLTKLNLRNTAIEKQDTKDKSLNREKTNKNRKRYIKMIFSSKNRIDAIRLNTCTTFLK